MKIARFSPRSAILVALGVLFAWSCSDETGPTTARVGRLAVAPVFQTTAASIIEIAEARFLVTRPADGSIVKDTVVTIAPGQDTVDVAITVPVLTPGEVFLLTLSLIDPAGDTVFVGGPTEVTPSTSGGTPAPVPVEVIYVGVGFDAASVVITPPDTFGFSTETVQLTAVALDSLGEPIAGTPIVWSSLDTALATVPDPGTGQVLGGPTRGTARIVAELLTGPRDTATVRVQPLPTAIVADSGNNQTGPMAAALPQPLVARVTAPDGQGVEGLWVRFAVTAGGGSVSIDSVLTDAAGRARVTWTLGPTVGPQTVEATTARLPASTATFTATAQGSLVIVSGDAQTGTVGAALAQPLVVRAEDPSANPVVGVSISWTVTQGNGAVGTATSVTDASGLASTTFTLGTAAGAGHEVTATITGSQTSVPFSAFALPGPPASLAFVVQPTTVDARAIITPAVVVELLDSFGNRVTTDNSTTVDIAITTGTGTAGATLSGTLTQTASVGLVTFADLSIDLVGTGYTLDASIPSLTQVTSAPFDVLPPPGIAWINPAGGNWSNGANWAGGIPPGAADLALIDLDGTYTVTVDVPVTVSGVILGAATGTQTLDIPGNPLTIVDSGRVGTNGLLQLSGVGTIDGAGSLAVDGTFSWSGGTQSGTGTTAVSPGGTLFVFGTPAKTLTDRQVSNAGTFTLNGTGNIQMAGGATVVNAAGGLLDMQTTAGFTPLTGAPSMTNQGTLQKIGAGTATIGVPLTNDPTGLIDTRLGTLAITEGTLDGTVYVAFGATLQLVTNFALLDGLVVTDTAAGAFPGTLDLTGMGTSNGSVGIASSWTLPGSVDVQTGTLDFNGASVFGSASGAITVGTGATLAFSGSGTNPVLGSTSSVTGLGTVLVSQAVTVQGTYSVDRTTISASGAIFDASSATPVTSRVASLGAGTEVRGTGIFEATDSLVIAAATMRGTGLTRIPAGALLLMTGGINLISNGRALENSGTIEIADGSFRFDNGGTVNNLVGGLFDIQTDNFSFTFQVTGGGFNNGGTLRKSVGVGINTFNSGVTFTNTGTIDIQTGTLQFGGSFAHVVGGIIQGTGTLDLAGATVSGFDGDINPGTSPGILNLIAPAGGLVQTTGARYRFEVDGTTPGVGHDQLNISGTATFGGTFDLLNTVQPLPYDVFTVLTFTNRGIGVSPTVTGIDLGGIMLDTAWAATQLNVVAQPSVIFAGDSAGGLSSGVFRLHPNGLLQVNTTPEGPPAETMVHPRWSPDRTRITYTARPGFGPNQLHIATADGSVIAHPTSATDTSTFRPRFNATGNRIAFECGDGQRPDEDVCVIPDVSGPVSLLDGIGDGAGKIFLTDLATPFTIGPAGFSWDPTTPDQIAFFRDSVNAQGDTVSHLFTSLFDGTGMVNRTPSGMDNGQGPLQVLGTIDWSPDGSLIAFAARAPGQFDTDIFVIAPDGTGLRRVADQAGTPLRQPVFSPDGATILFAAFIDGFSIHQVPSSAVDLPGIAMTPLFNFNFALAGYDWSPDGKEIVLNEDFSTPGRVIAKILPTTTSVSYPNDVVIIGRSSPGFLEVQDNQPSWRR